MNDTIYIILLVILLHCMRMKGLKRDKMILLFVQIIEEEGERLKFLKIYENYRYRMLYISKHILNDQGLAEDAVQESFLYLAVNIHTIDTDILSPRTRNFIYLVTRHKSIDLLRKAKRDISISEEKLEYLTGSYKHVEEIILERDVYAHVLRSILDLPLIYRECLELNIVYELSAKKIALLMGISYETVKKRILRGKALLREKIDAGYR